MKTSKKFYQFFGAIAVSACIVSCSGDTENTAEDVVEGGDSTTTNIIPNSGPYPNFGYMIDSARFAKEYPGEQMFVLAQDFPETCDEPIPDFFKYDWSDREKFMDWINAARDYCFEGMIDVDFKPQLNDQRDWYQMPWLHYGPQGTEGFHGLAKEAEESPYQLRPNQTEDGQTYAIGFYNAYAGTVLHEMWGNPENIDPNATQGPDGGFPHGTVIFKLLFSTLDETQVDYLENPFTWNAYITPTWDDSVKRVVRQVNLIQMDLMVRDTAANKEGSGWIFGTFCYNGALNDGKEMKDRVKNLVPVGIQFGNDPQYTTNWFNPYPFTETIINDTLEQTFINPSSDLPPQHLGWGGRLDGPVDLNTASCMSCHSTGEYPQVAALVPSQAFVGDTNKYGAFTHLTETDAPAFVKYFQNLECATAYNPNQATSTDFSLQVSLALQYHDEAKSAKGAGSVDENGNIINQVTRNHGSN